MEFKLILQKLKHSNAIISSSISKEIVSNIRHVTKTELLDTLEMLQGTADMEFQIKLISILSACLLFNTSNRDVIVNWTSLYDTLYTILSRGLPLKSTVALNFITSLLYEGAGGAGARGRTLSLRARAALRTSGCLAAMTQLFANYMLHTDTWNALCRCIAEVCYGSEVNQTYCSHLVPLCIQRCLQGNLEVFLVLQSLLYNHKRNTHLFLEADGMSVFERQECFRYERCLQLLNTVVQVIEVEELRIIKNQNKIFVNLQNVLQLQNVDSRIRQWATIILYHLESKLKENERYNKSATVTKSDNNKNKDIPTNVDDTQVLFQNIMTEILSCPTKTNEHNPWKRIYKMPDKISALNNKAQRLIAQTKVYCNERTSLDEEIDLSWNSNHSCKEELTFYFLMDETIKCGQSEHINNGPTNKMNRTVSKLRMSSKQRDEHDQNGIEFNPTFVSTPIKVQPNKSTSLNKHSFVKRSFMVGGNKSGIRNNTKRNRITKRTLLQDSRVQDSIKQRSMSARLFDAINESCTTFIKSVKNVFTGNKTTYNSNKETTIINSINNQNEKSYCSYSFTNYMQKREAELNENKTYCEISSEMITLNTMNTCKTCDDTARLKQKFDNDDHLKLTVKKLKLGINLYGCDFKKISKTMWPRETYMTPSVLYNLYRKLILK